MESGSPAHHADRLFASLPAEPTCQMAVASALSERILQNALAVANNRVETLRNRCRRQRSDIDDLQSRVHRLERENEALRRQTADLNVAVAHFRDEILPRVQTVPTGETARPVGHDRPLSHKSHKDPALDVAAILDEIDRAMAKPVVPPGSATSRQKHDDASRLFFQIRKALPPAAFSEFLRVVSALPAPRTGERPSSDVVDRVRPLLAQHDPDLFDRFRRLVLNAN